MIQNRFDSIRRQLTSNAATVENVFQGLINISKHRHRNISEKVIAVINEDKGYFCGKCDYSSAQENFLIHHM